MNAGRVIVAQEFIHENANSPVRQSVHIYGPDIWTQNSVMLNSYTAERNGVLTVATSELYAISGTSTQHSVYPRSPD